MVFLCNMFSTAGGRDANREGYGLASGRVCHPCLGVALVRRLFFGCIFVAVVAEEDRVRPSASNTCESECQLI